MKVKEIHVYTRSDHCHKYKNCDVIIDSKFISIKEGSVDNIFPLDAVEVISSLREGDLNEQDNQKHFGHELE